MGHAGPTSAPLRPVSEMMTNLLASTQQKVPMKDFGSEVRASMDIAHFLSQATLVLDVAETSLEGICDLLLTKLLEQDEPLCSVAEAKSILFTHDTCKYLCVHLTAARKEAELECRVEAPSPLRGCPECSLRM